MKIIILMFFEDKNLVNCQFLGLEWAWGILDDPLLNLRNVQVRLSSFWLRAFGQQLGLQPTILFYLSVPLPLWQKSELRHYTKGAPLCVPIYFNCSHECFSRHPLSCHIFSMFVCHISSFFRFVRSMYILAFMPSSIDLWLKSHLEKIWIV